MKIHPAANSFPMMDEKRFAELKDDIELNGQREPVTLCDGMILDGRNRQKACEELGTKTKTRKFSGDPWAYVWSLNGQRRDISEDVRAQVWVFINGKSEHWQKERERVAEEGNKKRGQSAKGNANASKTKNSGCTKCTATVSSPSRNAKAAAAKVNAGAVARAESLENKRPDLAAAVRKGAINPAEARRQAKKDEVADKVDELPNAKYTVIYADPPWSYNNKLSGNISESYGAAEKHYPSMSMSDLKALDVPALAANDAVLFLWATSPLLPEGLELMKAWGFKYKAAFIWDKVKHNMGHYNSVRHEFLLVGTRGSCTPQNVKLFDSVQSIERTKHSEKPDKFRDIIETLYPKGRKLEMFARSKRKGWKTWGNEA